MFGSTAIISFSSYVCKEHRILSHYTSTTCKITSNLKIIILLLIPFTRILPYDTCKGSRVVGGLENHNKNMRDAHVRHFQFARDLFRKHPGSLHARLSREYRLRSPFRSFFHLIRRIADFLHFSLFGCHVGADSKFRSHCAWK